MEANDQFVEFLRICSAYEESAIVHGAWGMMHRIHENVCAEHVCVSSCSLAQFIDIIRRSIATHSTITMECTHGPYLTRIKVKVMEIYLTFVDARVTMLWIFYLQYPIIRMRMMYGFETLIRCVGVSSHRQQMDITMSYPRYLK